MGNVNVLGAGTMTSVNGVTGSVQIGGTNLYVMSKSSDGYIYTLDGHIYPSGYIAKERISDYISVEPMTDITVRVWLTAPKKDGVGGISAWVSIAWFDENKQIIGLFSKDAPGVDVPTKVDYTFTASAPKETAYARVSARFYNDGVIMATHGNVAMDWSPAPEDIPSMAPVQSVNGATGAVQIGGANLLRNSATFLGWINYGAKIENKEKDPFGRENATLITSSMMDSYVLQENVFCELGVYTLSFYAKSSTPYELHIYQGADVPVSTVHLSQNWAKYIFTFEVSDLNSNRIYFGGLGTFNEGSSFYIFHPKMERGNVATDWSPAPEDIFDRLAALEAAAGITYEPPVYDGPETMDKPMGGDRNEAVR